MAPTVGPRVTARHMVRRRTQVGAPSVWATPCRARVRRAGAPAAARAGGPGTAPARARPSPSSPVTRSSRWVTVLGCTCRAAAVSLRLPPLANQASRVATSRVPRCVVVGRDRAELTLDEGGELAGPVVAEEQPRHAQPGGVADVPVAPQASAGSPGSRAPRRGSRRRRAARARAGDPDRRRRAGARSPPRPAGRRSGSGSSSGHDEDDRALVLARHPVQRVAPAGPRPAPWPAGRRRPGRPRRRRAGRRAAHRAGGRARAPAPRRTAWGRAGRAAARRRCAPRPRRRSGRAAPPGR